MRLTSEHHPNLACLHHTTYESRKKLPLGWLNWANKR